MPETHPETHPETQPEIRRPATAGPGWPEILVGLAVLALVAYGAGWLLRPLGLDPVVHGLLLSALSGVAGIAGFAAAVAVRRRPLPSFGIARTSVRWMLVGVGGGVLAFLLTRVMSIVGFALGWQPENIQQPYTDAGSAGTWSVLLSLLFLAVLTPIGEELTFRGVVTSALLRYGPLVAVVGSALIFAAMHGFNGVFVTALIVGLVAGELRRRSGSVWPGVAVHLVNNGLAQGTALLLAAAL